MKKRMRPCSKNIAAIIGTINDVTETTMHGHRLSFMNLLAEKFISRFSVLNLIRFKEKYITMKHKYGVHTGAPNLNAIHEIGNTSAAKIETMT